MSSHQKIRASSYRSAGGNEPVREWLKGLDKSDRQRIGEDIAYVQYKWPIGKPRVDHLRGPVWEGSMTFRVELDNPLPTCRGGSSKSAATIKSA